MAACFHCHPGPKNYSTQYEYRVRSDALRPIVIYNPTNGLISEGDFGAFRGKFNAFIPKDLQ